MRMSRTLLLISLLVAGCSKPSSTVDAELATQRLCNHVSDERKTMIVNPVGSETVWSDGAILERAADFPAPLKALIAHPTATTDMLGFLQDIDARRGEWHHAEQVRTDAGDFGCAVTDQKITAPVNCLYTTYLKARYPMAEAELKTPTDPILFVVGGRVRAVLMPVKW